MSAYEAQFRDAVSRLVAEALTEERSLERAFECVALAAETHGRATERALDRTPPPRPIACAKGCAWCCHLKVAVTPAEALRLAAHVRETLGGEELSALVRRLAETEACTWGLPWQEHIALGLPCPLLTDDACSVHPVRPLSCRGHNSLDAHQCARYNRFQGQITIPVYTPQADIAAGVRAGLSDGLEAAGLQGELLELVSALRTALETPDAAARWLSGERLFSNPPARRLSTAPPAP